MSDDAFQPSMLSPTAFRMIEVSRDPDVQLDVVVALMEGEPLLAAEVLGIAQAPIYSRGSPVEDLQEAVVRLGVPRVAGIFIEAAMRTATQGCRSYEKELEQVRLHSTACAHIARLLCRMLDRPVERTFTCALLHDIGMAGALMALSTVPKRRRPKDKTLILQAAVKVHEAAAELMGNKWRLPWGIQWVVTHHHSFWVDGRINPMAAMVAIADWLASEAGAAAFGEVNELGAMEAMEYFELSPQQQEELLQRSRRLADQIRNQGP